MAYSPTYIDIRDIINRRRKSLKWTWHYLMTEAGLTCPVIYGLRDGHSVTIETIEKVLFALDLRVVANPLRKPRTALKPAPGPANTPSQRQEFPE